jgi:hypothetical protein
MTPAGASAPAPARRAARLLGAVALVVVGAVAFGAPSQALLKPVLTVRAGQDAVVDLGPLAGNFPLGATGDVSPEPSDCDDPITYCDDVPFDVVVPPLPPADDWYVVVTVSWEPNQVEPKSGTQANDLDIFTYDDKQHDKAAGAETTGFTDTCDSASSVNPEIVKLYKPALGRYHIVVVNFSGANQAYHVKLHMVTSKFDSPFESLAPPPPPPPSKRIFSPPPTVNAGDTATASVGPVSDLPPAASDVAVTPDAQLANKARSTFDDQLAAPAATAFGGLNAASQKPPGPVSGLALFLAFVLVPGALVAGLYLVIRKQRSALFST